MNKSMVIQEEVLFNATIEQVWDLLTNPQMTKQYMFGSEIISTWEIGSSIQWKGQTAEGTDVIYVKGEILEYEEYKKITSTMFDPNSDMKDIPQNYVNLIYELSQKENGVLLTIIQGDFSMAENGAKRYEESKQGWKEIVIPLMKKML